MDQPGTNHQAMGEAADRAGERMADGKNAEAPIAGTASHAEREVEKAAADLYQHSERLLRDLQRFVRDHPLLSVGLAMTVGALLDSLLRRR